jgi:hypothetical protein
MSDRYLVFLADEDSAERGDLTSFEDAGEAAQRAESLLEAGYEQDRIRIFNASEMDVHVTHRPVVSLVNGEAGAGEPDDDSASNEREATAFDEGDGDGEGEVAGVKDGVRLSSMFKSE